MSDERRRATRIGSSARILWRRLGDEFLQLDRVRDVSDSGAFVLSESISEPGAIVAFELRDDGGRIIAEGSARVARVVPGEGMGIAFLDAAIDAVRVSLTMPPPASLPLVIPSDHPLIIGIDLGTTNTCASWVHDGRPQIIPGRTGGNTIPSMVSFERDGRVHVGQRASDRAVLHPERTVYGSKRLLGRTYTEELALGLQPHFAYPLAQADGQCFGVDLGDRTVSMDALATQMLREVRSAAEDFLGRKVGGAVLTVPAYFSEMQREAVRRAADAAELTVHRLVNEPTAAAVAYGHHRGEEVRIAVWDFGGGTFDFSIVDIRDERYEVVATGGENFVGGEDFDDELASLILEQFSEAEGLGRFVPSPAQIARLREAAELCKRALSVRSVYDVRLPTFTQEPARDLFVSVTRMAFDARTKPLVDRTVAVAQEVLRSAGVSAAELDDVVLVGGTTRIPAVQRAVAELFQRQPSTRINPDEAVALGAAVLASEIGQPHAPTLLDVLPMTLGRALNGRHFLPIVKRNARVPFEKTLRLEGDAEGVLQVPLFQGEARDVARNEYLCTLVARDPRLRAGDKARIRLVFDEHCVMAVHAVIDRTGEKLEVVVERNRPLSDVLGELGVYEGPETDDDWKPPETRIGRLFAKVRGVFGSGGGWG